jgi:lipoate-protein ligase A
MQRLELTLATPAENLALDEALLDWAEEQNLDWEFLRIWESPQPIVVVGRSSRVHQEVDEAACRDANIPILRRSSGGAAIVAGPGCLMYAVVLSYRLRPELKDIGLAHAHVLGRLAATLGQLAAHLGRIAHLGTSDLVIADCGTQRVPGIADCDVQPAIRNPKSEIVKKFSGNSMRAKRTHLLYHGTLLYDADILLVTKLLCIPPRQPAYREARSHAEFLTNLAVDREALVQAIDRAWPTSGELMGWPHERVAALVAARFSQHSWNYEFV